MRASRGPWRRAPAQATASRGRAGPPARAAWLALPAAALVAAGAALGGDGVYTGTRHGDAVDGVRRLADLPPGDCGQCHDLHASRGGVPTGGPYPYALFAPNDSRLCADAGGAGGCHDAAGRLGIYAGLDAYERSSHATSPASTWPGPDPRARPAGDAGYCLNCHAPHGRADALGPVPVLLAVREEGSCLACHDASGPAATDVASDLRKPSRHPAPDHAARHDAAEAGDPAAFGGARRHAECADCHNPHDVRPEGVPPALPTASDRCQMVGRVSVINGAAGSRPVYAFRAADDPSAVLEYEICFKCHSSWTAQPPGQPDLAVLFNPSNASFHPVEDLGRSPRIDERSFVAPWSAASLTYCGDCHGSDDGRVRGPHGSTHADLLRAPHVASPARRTMGRDEVCFLCHAYETYAGDRASTEVQAYSRFNPPASAKGHTFHVADRGYPCYACHESHGTATLPALLAVGRSPGLDGHEQAPDGGRCFPTCHHDKTYAINYPR